MKRPTSQGVRVHVIGYGNPGRGDDALGPVLAARVEALGLPGVSVDSDYQLTVEDAAVVAESDVVLFIDADTTTDEPFYLRQLEPVTSVSFSSHSCRPEAVLGLAHDLFKADTTGFLLGVRGYEFEHDLQECLTPEAQANLEKAFEFIEPVIRERDFSRYSDAEAAREG